MAEPKKPRLALSGDGCALSMRATPPSEGASACASRPHRIATSGPPRAASASMASPVTSSQPRRRWEPAAPGETVSTRLSSITPCASQWERSPEVSSSPVSSRSSRAMLTNDRGIGCPGATEKLSPTGSPGVG